MVNNLFLCDVNAMQMPLEASVKSMRSKICESNSTHGGSSMYIYVWGSVWLTCDATMVFICNVLVFTAKRATILPVVLAMEENVIMSSGCSRCDEARKRIQFLESVPRHAAGRAPIFGSSSWGVSGGSH